MAAKIVKKEVMNDEIKEFGEDAATAINELLGLYGYIDENKRNEHNLKLQLNKNNGTRNITNSNQQSSSVENEGTLIENFNDYSSVSSEKDNTSRENSKSPMFKKSIEDKQENSCSWCHHDINAQTNEIIGSPDNVFCSENCFIYWRRASFKRAKTCDFCKNIRNAVSYVDFNDGTTQLQFCSDRCLNQYKMQIFCRETQAHLELNPHLREKKENDDSLITPELWLKNCRIRSPSPDNYEGSKSSSPLTITDEKEIFSKIIDPKELVPSSSSKTISSVHDLTNNEKIADAVKRPVINVLPSSKLLSRNMLINRNFRRRRISNRLSIGNKGNQVFKNKISCKESLTDDLRSKNHTQNINNPRPIQSTSYNRLPHQYISQTPSNLFKYRLPFSTLPRIPVPSQHQVQPPESSNPVPIMNPILPPPVLLVPYPIPLPIILPIPIPLSTILKAYQTKNTSSPTNENGNSVGDEKLLKKVNVNERPLDLSSDQSIQENGKSFNAIIDDYEEEELENISNIISSNSSDVNNLTMDKANVNENIKMNMENNLQKDMHERSRPLRKRKIISNQVDDN